MPGKYWWVTACNCTAFYSVHGNPQPLVPLNQIEAFTAEDAETIELPDDNERAALSADPLARLERSTLQAQAAASGRAQLLSLAEESELKHKDDYKLNKALRAKLRAAKKEDAKLDER